MGAVNLWVGWTGILAGLVAGAVIGLSFHDDDWLGGYGSWRRRMLRLGHISFFGIGFINVIFAITIRLDAEGLLMLASWLLIVSAAAMPAICFLSAWRKYLRHLFFVPVLCLVVGVSALLYEVLLR
jgi:hypothetical protein